MSGSGVPGLRPPPPPLSPPPASKNYSLPYVNNSRITADRVNQLLSPPVITLIAGNVISTPECNTETLSNVSTPNNQRPLPKQCKGSFAGPFNKYLAGASK